MASLNRVCLSGNLTRDVEVRYTPGGTAVADLGLAVSDRRKDAKGEWIDETTFVDCTAWGRTAEIAGEYLAKGGPVVIEGKLKLDSWERDGQKHSKLKVVVENLVLVGSKPPGSRPPATTSDTPRSAGGASRGRREPSRNIHSGSGAGVPAGDDIPFAAW
jgi:single-strand DNA-binding protein